jgi:hypothetical protein
MPQIKKWDDVHGNTTSDEHMAAFLESAADSYAVLQLKRTDETEEMQFMPYSYVQKQNLQPTIDHYEVVYSGSLERSAGTNDQLEDLYLKFNIDQPEDFRGHSMSVSDIVALKVSGSVSCYYVDPVGFQELPGFLKPENYLRNAEMTMEDDYGMIDGIINNGKAPQLEEANKPSVLEKLKNTPEQTTRIRSPRRTTERDLE